MRTEVGVGVGGTHHRTLRDWLSLKAHVLEGQHLVVQLVVVVDAVAVHDNVGDAAVPVGNLGLDLEEVRVERHLDAEVEVHPVDELGGSVCVLRETGGKQLG